MKKTYDKPEISIIILKSDECEVVTASASGDDGLSISLDWLLG